VSEMRQKLAAANKVTGKAPIGIGSLFANIPSSPSDIIIHVKDESAVPHPLRVISEDESDNDEEEDDGGDDDGGDEESENEEGEVIEKK
jgi:hypothetical protein